MEPPSRNWYCHEAPLDTLNPWNPIGPLLVLLRQSFVCEHDIKVLAYYY